MENSNEKELIEIQAFRMGKKGEEREIISGYSDTAEERDCFCF